MAGDIEFQARALLEKAMTTDSWKERIGLLKQAADLGNAEAQFRYHLNAQGLSDEEHLDLIRRSANGGYRAGQTAMANFYMDGRYYSIHVQKDFHEALKWFRAANFNGPAVALLEYAIRLEKEAEPFYSSVKAGDAEAQYRVGVYYVYGPFELERKKEGLRLLEDANSKGNTGATVALGDIYYNGVEVGYINPYATFYERCNRKLAVDYYLQAAEADDPAAQYMMGVLNQKGCPYNTCLEMDTGIRGSRSAAREWFEKAAAHGYQPAIKELEMKTGDGSLS